MTCWSCALQLPEGARFCARCGARQRVAGPSAPPWVLILFTFGTVAAVVLVAANAALLVQPAQAVGAAEVPYVQAGAWLLLAYGVVLAVLQVAALIGLGRSRDWGRLAATLACLLWCLTGFGLLVSFPVLYQLWRPQPWRR